MYFENFDLSTVVTPLKVNQFIQLLKEANYAESEIDFLQEGFTSGFDIGYEGPENRQSTADNIPFTVGNSTILWNKLMKEVKQKRVAGPFDCVPFSNFIQSPIGLVPKAGEDGHETRLIFHLSYDCKRDGNKSVNFHTPKEKCSAKYRDIDFAIATYLHIVGKNCAESAEQNTPDSESARRKSCWKSNFNGDHTQKNGKKTVFAGKSDLKSAFRILGLSIKS